MSNRDLQQLSDALRAARKAAGLTGQEVATRIKVDPATVSRVERGLSEPTATFLGRFAMAVGVDVEEFYALMGLAEPRSLPSLPTFLRAKHNMTPDQIARFEELLQEVESESTPTSPEGTRDGDPSP